MGKVWILDSETKGTGAHIAPLDQGSQAAPPEKQLSLVSFKASVSAPAEPEPRAQPRRFRVIDVMSSRVVLEDAGLEHVLKALEQMRTALDARIYVRERRSERWRLLTLAEGKAIWAFRGKSASTADAAPTNG